MKDKYQPLDVERIRRDNNREILALCVWAAMLALTGLALILLANTTLFEDGSIQFFGIPGLGFCLIAAMGC